MVVCLERGADLHMAQWMPLPLTVSCFSKIQIGLPFWYRLTWVVPEKGPLNVYVCVYISAANLAFSAVIFWTACMNMSHIITVFLQHFPPWCSLESTTMETASVHQCTAGEEQFSLEMSWSAMYSAISDDATSRQWHQKVDPMFAKCSSSPINQFQHYNC